MARGQLFCAAPFNGDGRVCQCAGKRKKWLLVSFFGHFFPFCCYTHAVASTTLLILLCTLSRCVRRGLETHPTLKLRFNVKTCNKSFEESQLPSKTPSLQNWCFFEGIVMGCWGLGASLRWEWRPAYWPVVLGDDGVHILWELRSKWNWEVFLQRWRGHSNGPFILSCQFELWYECFGSHDIKERKWLFSVKTRNFCCSQALSVKSKSPCQWSRLYSNTVADIDCTLDSERAYRIWTLMSLSLLYLNFMHVYAKETPGTLDSLQLKTPSWYYLFCWWYSNYIMKQSKSSAPHRCNVS